MTKKERRDNSQPFPGPKYGSYFRIWFECTKLGSFPITKSNGPFEANFIIYKVILKCILEYTKALGTTQEQELIVK